MNKDKRKKQEQLIKKEELELRKNKKELSELKKSGKKKIKSKTNGKSSRKNDPRASGLCRADAKSRPCRKAALCVGAV